METKLQSLLRFGGVEIYYVSLQAEKPNAERDERKIQFDIKAGYFHPEERTDIFRVDMDVEVKVEHYFAIRIRASAPFHIHESADEAQRKSFINVNAPAIMFPYVRAFIQSLTNNCGRAVPPVQLPPHSFSGDLPLIEPNAQAE